MVARGRDWLICVFGKVQETAPTATGTYSQPIATFSGKRIHEPVVGMLGLRCATFLARASHKESLTD